MSPSVGDPTQPQAQPWADERTRVLQEIATIRAEVDRSTKIVIWGFSLSWIAITAMFTAGFLYYLPAKLDPISEKVSKLETKVDQANVSLARIEGRLSIGVSKETGQASKSSGAPISKRYVTFPKDDHSKIPPQGPTPGH